MEIFDATTANISIIQSIAIRSWQETYRGIICEEQIEYMLDKMYSTDALIEQMDILKHRFVLIRREGVSSFEGFVSYETNYKNTSTTKLHKLYTLPSSQGHGLGRSLIETVCERAKKNGNQTVGLNMNRKNKALRFYQNMGFDIIGEEDIDIGNGYLMEDYIFEKRVE